MPSSRRSTNRSNKPAPSTRNDVYSGSSAREESERIVADAKRRQEEAGKNPFRFYLNVGDEKSFIILDDAPTFSRWEHEEWDARNKRMNHYGCVSATDNCPACDNLEYKSYFAMYLTILDLTPFKTKKGEEVEFSKKLLVVKPNQHKIFWRKFDKSGSLRGVQFDSFRDKKTDARIGGSLDYTDTLTEEELSEYVSEYDDADGKTHTNDVKPYDYFDLFPETTLESLEEIFGSNPAAGSSREAKKELEDDWVDDDEDTVPFKDDDRPTRKAREDRDEPSRSSRTERSSTRRPARRRT